MQAQPYAPHGEEDVTQAEHQPQLTGSDQVDSPGKKKSVLGKVKEKAKKLKSKVKKKSGTGHGNEGEGDDHEDEEENGSNGDDNEADVTEGQMEEENYQKDAVDEKDKHPDIISGLDGFGTKDILKGAQTEASAEPDVPPLATSGVAAGGPYSDSLNEERKLGSEYPSSLTRPVAEEPESTSEAATSVDNILQPAHYPVSRSREEGEGLRPRDQKDDIETRSLKDDPVNKGSGYGGESALEPSHEREGEDVTSSLTTETGTDEQPQTLTDKGYQGIDAAKGSVAAAAAGAAGALGFSGASGGEQQQDAATGGKSYLDLGKEKFYGLKDSITGPAQGEKKEGIETSQGSYSQGSSHVTERTVGTMKSFKDTIASKLGYGGTTPTVEGQDVTSSSPVSSEEPNKITDKPAGTIKSFKDTIASKLGYGGAAAESGQGIASSVPENFQESGEQKPYTQKLYDTVGAVKDTAASKLGYGGETDKENLQPSVVSSEAHPDQKSYTQKLYDTAAGATGVVASKLGYNRTASNKAEGKSEGLGGGVASEYSEGKNEGKVGQAANRFSPGEEEKALSQLITDAVSNSAATVKGTLLIPFSGRSNNSVSPSSSSTATTAKQGELTDDALSNPPASPGGQSKGIMDRVTGVVTSMLGKKPSGEKNAELPSTAAETVPSEATTT